MSTNYEQTSRQRINKTENSAGFQGSPSARAQKNPEQTVDKNLTKFGFFAGRVKWSTPIY